MSDLDIARERLRERWLSFCIVKDGKVAFESMSAGIKDIYHLVYGHQISGSSIADKIIGKAVALLILEGGVKAAFASSINQNALNLLSSAGIEVQYDNLMNRLESMCQFEKAVKDVSDPKDAISVLRQFS